MRGTRSAGIRSEAAGPLLIVAAVLVVLHDFVLRDVITAQHLDVLAYWLPTYCFLGDSLASGQLPTWNPYVMGGVPFVADPQSGWMNLQTMLLFAGLPCGAAIRWLIVLPPILAGLGLYGFLRGEGLSRPAASVGGLSLALGMAASMVVLSVPFAGTLAWTALLLAAASGYLRAGAWWSRLLWLLAAGVAWGQVAASHPAHGLVVGTGALVAYAVARSIKDLRRGTRTPSDLALLGGLLVLALPLLNLALFLPRLGYLPETTLGMGYDGMREVTERITATGPQGRPVSMAIGPAWPLMLATSPGAYLGAAVLGLSFAGWWSRRHRYLVGAFTIFAALCYVLALRPFALSIIPLARQLPFGDVYLHAPMRLALGLLVALPVLGALGVEALRHVPRGGRRLAMLAPGLLLWGAVPLWLLIDRRQLALLVVGAAGAAVAASLAARRPALFSLVPILLSAELVANGLLGQATAETRPKGLEPRVHRPLTNFPQPAVRVSSYLREGPIAEALGESGPARYVTLGRPRLGWYGYLRLQRPAFWPLLQNNRSLVFRLESIQGYNPVQPRRFWMFVRTAHPELRVAYKRTLFERPAPEVLDLLQVGWVVGPADQPPLEGLSVTAREGRWALYRRASVPPRAFLATAWRVASSESEALDWVLDPGFDSSTDVVLEQDPGFASVPGTASGGAEGRAAYRPLGSDAARIDVEARVPSVLVIRNAFDRNWRATVDGKPVPVHPADSLLQAVPVPAGRHTVVMRHDDPLVGYGLAGSGLSVAVILAASALWWRRERLRRDILPPAWHVEEVVEPERADQPVPALTSGMHVYR